MSEPRLNTLYAFPRKTRQRCAGTPDEAVTIDDPTTMRIACDCYRSLRRGGLPPYQARITVWLLLAATTGRTVVEQVTL